MECPLMVLARFTSERSGFPNDYYCLGEKCAWYDEGSSACAIWSLMSGLDALGKVLREIEQKLPLGR